MEARAVEDMSDGPIEAGGGRREGFRWESMPGGGKSI